MANNLNAAEVAVLAGPVPDLSAVTITGSLNESGFPAGAANDITDRVISFGRCRIGGMTGNPRRSPLDFAAMSWTVDNHDGLFTRGHANEIWNAKPPQAWQALYTARVTSQTVQLLTLHFDVYEVRLVEDTAQINSVHMLARLLAHRWRKSDRHATTWNVGHTVTL